MLLKLIGAKNLLAASGVKYISHDTKGDIMEYDVDTGVGKELLTLVNDKNIPYFSTLGDSGAVDSDEVDSDETEVESEDGDTVETPVETPVETKKKTTIKVGGKKTEKSVSV